MDKLSEYIPLLIILVSVIFSLMGKKKKPGNAKQETTFPEIPVGEFVDERGLPPVLTGSYSKVVSGKPKQTVIQKPEITKKKEFMPSFFSDIEKLESEEENENSPFSFEDEADVRRAIIYSEIINKKEY